ncbi:MAG: TlpA family protein disulfide reductase [Actinobacteria bacterium]|nr:TlpA family protein disulfide reductase [Actinomycetota bacterium]
MSLRSSIVAIAVLAAVGLLVYGLASKGGSEIAVGDPAPQTMLDRLEGGGQESLADYRGRWVMVNFWASWCVPCRDEAKTLNELQAERGGPKFTVLGIDSNDLSPDAKSFVKRYGIEYPQLRDGNGDLAHEFGTTGVPESYLFNPQGKLKVPWRGPVDKKILQEQFLPVIPQKGNS